MKCPKCGFNSFDHLASCKKCGSDLQQHRSKFGLRTHQTLAAPVSSEIRPALTVIPEPPPLTLPAENHADSENTEPANSADAVSPETFQQAAVAVETTAGIDDELFSLDLGPEPEDEDRRQSAQDGLPDDDFISFDVSAIGLDEPTGDAPGTTAVLPAAEEVTGPEPEPLDWKPAASALTVEPAPERGLQPLEGPLAGTDLTLPAGWDEPAAEAASGRDFFAAAPLASVDPAAPATGAGGTEDFSVDLFDEADRGAEQDQPAAALPAAAPFLFEEAVAEPGPTSETPTDELPLLLPAAPTGQRLGASLIDLVVIAAVFTLFLVAGGVLLLQGGQTPVLSTEALINLSIPYFLVFFTLCFGYFTLFHFLTGQTPGKMLFGLSVVDEQGDSLLLSQAFLRSVGGLLSLLPAGIGFLSPLLARDGRGWSDRIAGSRVVPVSQLGRFLPPADDEADFGPDDAEERAGENREG